MSINILHRGRNASVLSLADACFEKQNFVAGVTHNATLSIKTPVGVLGGSVAAFGPDNTAVPADGVNKPAGIFFFDSADYPYQNLPTEASGKLAISCQMPIYEVDVYETYNTVASADIVYVAGDYLYASANGLLTNVESTEGTIIGVVSKAPTTENPTMVVFGRI